MKALRPILEKARAERVFSGAAWSVGTADGVLDRGWTGTRRHPEAPRPPAGRGAPADPTADGGPTPDRAGNLGPAPDGAALDGTDLWDLASVTKPVVGLAVMVLADRGVLALTDTVGDRLPQYAGTARAPLTVAELLTHTSGLPGGVPMYRDHPTRESLLAALGTLPAAPPGTRVVYSSQGFMLLGLIAEAASGTPLDVLVEETVCAPLGMSGTGFTPDAAGRARAVATEDCPWRGRVVAGEVHDENAVVLGGVCGHAGLFAPLGDMERLGASLAGGARALLRPGTYALMTAPHTDGLGLRRGLAWQGLDPVGSPVGTAFGPASYGHTGFTGTSIWVDPVAGLYAVLLTNRVHPTRAGEGIAAVRRAFHNTAHATYATRAEGTGPGR